MEGRSSADRRGDRYHIILCVVIGEMTLLTCLLCRLLTQDENQSTPPTILTITIVVTYYCNYMLAHHMGPSTLQIQQLFCRCIILLLCYDIRAAVNGRAGGQAGKRVSVGW